MADDFFLKRGERGLLVGRTGSGKTQNALLHLRSSTIFPVIMLDTKIEPAFFSVPDESDTFEVVESLDEFIAMSKRKRKDVPDYILVRPGIHEMSDTELLDEYSATIYHRFGACFAYYDEIYQWHNNGRPHDNFLALLTRGRSKGKTILMASQRPSYISRFCFSESNKFYLYDLSDLRDRKTIDSMVPNYSRLAAPPDFHFRHFKVGQKAPMLYSPVEFVQASASQRSRHRWL